MTNTSVRKAVIAIDGGGTRCRVAYVAADLCEVVEGGASNACSNFDGTVQSINAALQELGQRLAMPVSELHSTPAYAGLAGVIDKTIESKLHKTLPFNQLKIEDDRHCAVRAALGMNDGILCHCGTGSFFALQSHNAVRYAGGWGPVLGDTASAYWLGTRALSLTLNTVDGLFESTPLAEHFLDVLEGTSGIVNFAALATPAEIGALAESVSEYAASQDALAVRALTEGASLIADTLVALGWTKNLPICLAGGVGTHYQDYLPKELQACIASPKGEPIDGAIALAQAFLQELQHEG